MVLLAVLTAQQVAIWRSDVALWETALALQPQSSALFGRVVVAYDKAGRSDVAGQMCDRFGLMSDFSIICGQFQLLNRHDPKGAIVYFEKDIAMVPDRALGYYHLAYTYSSQQDWTKALEAANQAWDLRQNYGITKNLAFDILKLQATANFNLKHYQEAEAAYARLVMVSSDPVLRWQYALSQWRTNKKNEACDNLALAGQSWPAALADWQKYCSHSK
jgi:tetratricopeptide (TPR) repeat protein